MKTRTGNYPIGFRRGGSAWQHDTGALVTWAVENGLEVIDLRDDAHVIGRQVLDAGLRIGSVDLPDNKGMIAADKGRRQAAIARNAEYVRGMRRARPHESFPGHAPRRPVAATRWELRLYGREFW